MGETELRSKCKSQGMSYATLSVLEKKECLILFHRRRELPLLSLEHAELIKLAQRVNLDVKGKALVEPRGRRGTATATSLELVELLSIHFNSLCVPNGILDDLSSNELVESEPYTLQVSSAGQQLELDPAILADPVNRALSANTSVAASSSSPSSSRSSSSFSSSSSSFSSSSSSFSSASSSLSRPSTSHRTDVNSSKKSPAVILDPSVTVSELIRQALRVGWTPEDLLQSASKHNGQLTRLEPTKAIANLTSKPGWELVPLPPDNYAPLKVPREQGSFTGTTPLQLCVDSLEPSEQGLVGIGRFGLLNRSTSLIKFVGRTDQHLHYINHTETVHPGLVWCWLCESWLCHSEDPDHDTRCRERYFEGVASPVLWDSYILQPTPPNSYKRTGFSLFLSISAPSKVIYNRDRAIVALLSFLGKQVVRSGRAQSQAFRIRQASYTCPFAHCGLESPSLATFLHHVASTHRVPLFRRGPASTGTFAFDYDVAEDFYEHPCNSETALRLWVAHPPIVETVDGAKTSSGRPAKSKTKKAPGTDGRLRQNRKKKSVETEIPQEED